jgi:hypothetical protein
MNAPLSNETVGVAAADVKPRRFQCLTLPNDSVLVNGEDYDAMAAELVRLRAEVDRDKNRECANAWHTVFDRLRQIDPQMHERKNSGLASALDLIDELANRPALDVTKCP